MSKKKEMTKLIVAFRSYSNSPKNRHWMFSRPIEWASSTIKPQLPGWLSPIKCGCICLRWWIVSKGSFTPVDVASCQNPWKLEV